MDDMISRPGKSYQHNDKSVRHSTKYNEVAMHKRTFDTNSLNFGYPKNTESNSNTSNKSNSGLESVNFSDCVSKANILRVFLHINIECRIICQNKLKSIL